MNHNLLTGPSRTGKILLWIGGGLAAAATVWAVSITTMTRTTALLTGVAQRPVVYLPGTNQPPFNLGPTIDVMPIAGHNLVNLAMGRDVFSTNLPTQVLALDIPCDLSTASLVIFDQTTSKTIKTIATSLRFDSVHSPVTPAFRAAGLGRTNEIIRFITHLQINSLSSVSSNARIGGELTVAGRVHRDSLTGCPAPVPVEFDVDRYDRAFLDKDVRKRDDKDTARPTARTGLAHVIGVLQLVSQWQTNTVIVPTGNLSIRRDAEIIK